MSEAADTPRPAAFADAVRVAGVLLFGAGLVLLASSDLPAPVPWSYGLLPLAVLWLTRRVGLLFGTLAATATVGAVYSGGIREPSQLFFVAVLAMAGILLSACARRGVKASAALALAVTPVLAVAGGYLLGGGMQELSGVLAARLEEIRRLETEHGVSRTLGLSAAEFQSAVEETARVWTLLLPSLFALKWVVVMAINCWLASVLFQAEDGFPAFEAFSTWRVHPAAAWAVALALALIVTRWTPGVEAGVNLVFPLAIAYAIQGFAVARFAAIAFEMRGVVQAAIAMLVVLMPILLVVFLGIGFLDSWFDFRRRIVLGMDDTLGAGGGA
ncbi:MAG TPA: DUF2232 domain-containing protein [Candidatus Eisenbacteria bacterium]|nr:DUF2232 domain-containing protein [Candidatus Eisenbacteria bacterium]